MRIEEDLSTLQPRFPTIGENILWAYACWQMFWATYVWGEASFSRKSYMLRAKAFNAYKAGQWHIHDLYENNLAKIRSANCCWYCRQAFPQKELTVDHVFPRAKGGKDQIDNIVYVCGSCNSSKGKKDLIRWFLQRHEMPHYYLIGHYLKQVFLYTRDNGLMDLSVEDAPSNLPFELSGIYFFQQVKHLSAYLQYLQTKAGALSDLSPV